MSIEDLKNVALAAGMDAVEVGKVLDSEPLCQAAVAAGARRPELEAVNTQSDPKAGSDEGLLSFFLRHPRLYGESL